MDELARVGVARVDGELVAVLRDPPQVVDVGEVELGVHSLGEHVEGEGHHVHVAGALPVSEQGPLDTVRSGHERELRRRDPGPPIVVRVEAQDDALAVAEVAAEPLDLVGVDVGGRHLDGGRQVDDHPLGRGRLVHVHHRLADLDRVVEFRPGEAFRGVLVDPLRLGAGLGQLADELRAAHRDLGDPRPVEPEDDPPLQGRGRVVEVDDPPLRAREALERAGDELGPRLGEDLHGHVVGDRVVLDEVAAEVEVGLRCGGEADLDLLEPHLHEGLEHALLALVVHRVDEGLVAVAKVDAAPDGRVGDDPARPLCGPAGRWARTSGTSRWASARGPAGLARLPAREPRGPGSIRSLSSSLQKRESPPSFPGAGFVTVRSAQHYVPADPLRVPARARSASSAFMARILGPPPRRVNHRLSGVGIESGT